MKSTTLRNAVDDPAPAMLAGVSKSYGSTVALRDVSLTIEPGELVALLGPNGAGKTTAVKLLLGLLPPSSGTARVFGANPREAANRMRTGAMLQIARVPETLRVREHIDLFSSYYRTPMPYRDVIDAAGLRGVEERKFGDLSGGQRQRLLFALAICGNPDLLILDEPTVGLDIEARRGLWVQIRALLGRGKSVLLTTHYLEEADALANRVIVIDRGTIIAEGTPDQIKQRAAGKRIRCRTALSVDDVRAIPFVTTVDAEEDAVVIGTPASDIVIRELLARDPGLSDLEITSAGLEEAFLALTGSGR
ncbi:MAG TPA: ABC transporter ATP-binding protein [Thermoanaerobaculia bacterium]|jgi:ABC-2 type transport system ATP-binding protein